MLALRKSKPCSAMAFKGVGNKMPIDDSILWEKYWVRLIFCKPGTSLAEMGKASGKSWIK